MALRSGQVLAQVQKLLEDVTIVVDTATPADPDSNFVITNQDQADAVGPFKTIPAAVNALPNILPYVATITVAAGTHNLDSDFLGNYERFVFNPTPSSGIGDWTTGAIRIQSVNGMTRVGGTSTYNYVSKDAARKNFTVHASPGVANTYQGKFLRVLSGTGAGQVRPLWKHTGSVISIAGLFSPALDVTSVFEIVEPSTTLVVDAGNYGWPGARGMGANFRWGWSAGLHLKNIEIDNQVDGTIVFDYMRVILQYCTLSSTSVMFQMADADIQSCVFDGRGNGSAVSGVLQLVDTTLWGPGVQGSLFFNSTGSGISMGNGDPGGYVSIQNHSFADLGGDCVVVHGDSIMYTTNGLYADSVTGYGYRITNGSLLRMYNGSDWDSLTGTAGDILLDYSAVTYAVLDANSVKSISGPHGSVARRVFAGHDY